jgi:hypothetical protein
MEPVEQVRIQALQTAGRPVPRTLEMVEQQVGQLLRHPSVEVLAARELS